MRTSPPPSGGDLSQKRKGVHIADSPNNFFFFRPFFNFNRFCFLNMRWFRTRLAAPRKHFMYCSINRHIRILEFFSSYAASKAGGFLGHQPHTPLHVPTTASHSLRATDSLRATNSLRAYRQATCLPTAYVLPKVFVLPTAYHQPTAYVLQTAYVPTDSLQCLNSSGIHPVWMPCTASNGDCHAPVQVTEDQTNPHWTGQYTKIKIRI